MKNLYRYLSPFSPDQSGAVSVLYELGGIIVILDAGGCAGNICGFDEPRWFRAKSAVYSAGLRDLDAILGRDDKLIAKLAGAVETYDANYIAFIGTPVPAIVGTDLKALTRMAEKKFGIPSLAVDTNGMEYYDVGQTKSYMAMLKLLESGSLPSAPSGYETGVLGATPLDLPADDSASLLKARLEAQGYGKTVVFGMESGLAEFGGMTSVSRNVVVSPSGLKPARYLESHYGIPYETGFAFDAASGNVLPAPVDGNVLILHQQILANSVRDAIAPIVSGQIDVATFFQMDADLAKPGDVHLEGEDDFIKRVRSGHYAAVIGDPTFQRPLSFYDGQFLPLPHYAVSGEMHQQSTEKELWK